MGKRTNSGASAMLVAENIREIRKKLGISIQIAAERCHLTENKLMELESGEGVFDSAIILLKVAEGYTVDYQTIFKTNSDRELLNAFVPVEVYRGIHQLLKERSIKVSEFCEMAGFNQSAFYYWMKGTNNASVLSFTNMINLLQLKASDLEKMVQDAKLIVVQTTQEIKSEPKDSFEDRVLKIMRLQKNIGEYVRRLDVIVGEVTKLREELVMLQEQ